MQSSLEVAPFCSGGTVTTQKEAATNRLSPNASGQKRTPFSCTGGLSYPLRAWKRSYTCAKTHSGSRGNALGHARKRPRAHASAFFRNGSERWETRGPRRVLPSSRGCSPPLLMPVQFFLCLPFASPFSPFPSSFSMRHGIGASFVPNALRIAPLCDPLRLPSPASAGDSDSGPSPALGTFASAAQARPGRDAPRHGARSCPRGARGAARPPPLSFPSLRAGSPVSAGVRASTRPVASDRQSWRRSGFASSPRRGRRPWRCRRPRRRPWAI